MTFVKVVRSLFIYLVEAYAVWSFRRYLDWYSRVTSAEMFV